MTARRRVERAIAGAALILLTAGSTTAAGGWALAATDPMRPPAAASGYLDVAAVVLALGLLAVHPLLALVLPPPARAGT